MQQKHLKKKKSIFTSFQGVASRILSNAKTISVRFPNVLLVIIILGSNNNPIGDQESRIEPDSKLPDHIVHILRLRARVLHLAQKFRGARLGNRSQIVHQILPGHSDARVRYVQHPVLLIGLHSYVKVGVGVEHLFLRQREQADFVEGVGRVRDQLAQKDFLVAVQGVDDQFHHAVHLGLECEFFRFSAELLDLGDVESVQLDGLFFPFQNFIV